MTPKEFLALCRDQGYEGPGTRASVKAWLDSDDAPEIELYDTKGTKLQFDTIWPAKVVQKGIRIGVSKTDAEPDTVEVADDTGMTPPAADPGMGMDSAAKSTRPTSTKANQATGIQGMVAAGKAGFTVRPELLSYKSKIKRRGQAIPSVKQWAVFDDVDRAEVAGAYARLAVAESNGIRNYSQKGRDLEIVGKGAVEGINAQGGSLVPQDFIPELITVLNEYSATRQLLNVRTLSRDSADFPRRTADPTVSWLAEAAAASDQNPAYDNVRVNTEKMVGLMYVTNELLNDSAISVVDDLFNGFANGIGQKEDNATYLGDGTSTYGGFVGFKTAITSATATIYTQASGNTWATLTDTDLQGMLGLVQSIAWSGSPKMTCTPAAFYNIVNRVSRGIGGVTYTESQTGVVRPVYNGYPVVFNNVMAAATAVSTLSIFFGEFDYAAKAGVTAGSLEFATSDQYRFANDQITLRARERFGVTVHDVGDTTNAGPVVALKTGS